MINKETWKNSKDIYESLDNQITRIAGLSHYMDKGAIRDDLVPIIHNLKKVLMDLYILNDCIESEYIRSIETTGDKL